MSRNLSLIAWAMVATFGAADWLVAERISIPNASFESPATSFVVIDFDSWQKTPKPDWYSDADNSFLWSQLVGDFKNTAPGSANRIDNCNGNQAIWLFAVPEVTLFQDYDSMDFNDPAPSHAFDARFEIGKSYHLTVGVIGTGGGMRQGVTLDLSLYYRDALSNRIPVAVTTLTNLITVFSNNTHLLDCWVHAPAVQATDPWAGQHIGIQFASTVSSNLQGGYWDLDNVRLASGPALEDPMLTNGQFCCTFLGAPGHLVDILGASDPSLPIEAWTSVGTLTNGSGLTSFTDPTPIAEGERRFYRARQLP